MQGMAEPLLGLRLRRGPTSRGPEIPSLGPAPEATAPPSMGARARPALTFRVPALSQWAAGCPRGWLPPFLFPEVGQSSRWQHV